MILGGYRFGYDGDVTVMNFHGKVMVATAKCKTKSQNSIPWVIMEIRELMGILVILTRTRQTSHQYIHVLGGTGGKLG